MIVRSGIKQQDEQGYEASGDGIPEVMLTKVKSGISDQRGHEYTNELKIPVWIHITQEAEPNERRRCMTAGKTLVAVDDNTRNLVQIFDSGFNAGSGFVDKEF